MRVLPKKAQSPIRREAPEPKPVAQSHAFPAPTRGLVLNENAATPSPGAAQVLDNFVCTPTGIRARGGSQRFATLPGPATGMIAYRAADSQLFATTETGIYNITGGNPLGAVAVVTDATGGDYSHTMFGTAGGSFLYVVNGSNPARLYNGTTWTTITGASTPAITGIGTSALSFVWPFANRLWFIERDTLRAWYLPVDSIGGAANSFSLAGIFKLGGSLLFGASWSMDAGDGLDDKCIFVSTEGEVAVYEGSNPGSASEWRLAGVYQISRPLGKNATMKAGGDLLIATEGGLVPLSQVVQKDPAALSLSAVSARITSLWETLAATHDKSWHIVKWPEKGVMLVSAANAGDDRTLLCCSLQTGAWSRWTGIRAQCMEYFDGFAYAGGRDGIITRLETGGNDQGKPYTCVYVGAHESLGSHGLHKTAHQAQALFRTAHVINPRIGMQTDYRVELPPPPDSLDYSGGSRWDEAVWDTSIWDGMTSPLLERSYWRSVGRTGIAMAPELQMTFNSFSPPSVELVSIDLTYSAGALVA